MELTKSSFTPIQPENMGMSSKDHHSSKSMRHAGTAYFTKGKKHFWISGDHQLHLACMTLSFCQKVYNSRPRYAEQYAMFVETHTPTRPKSRAITSTKSQAICRIPDAR